MRHDRIVCWFSCGAASAVATMLTVSKRPDAEIVVARCIVPEEDPDNDRFAHDCERWFKQPIHELSSDAYASCEDVWKRRRYMAGPRGAICTVEMKKAVRHTFEREWQPDYQVFGYTIEEAKRVERFRAQNPDVRLLTPLIDAGLDKGACFAILAHWGIQLPLRYRQGFSNANCRGCVQAQSPGYWNRERRVNPDVFAARAVLSRELGVRLVKRTSGARERIFLDELDPAETQDSEPETECSLLCFAASTAIAGGTP